MRRLMVGLVLGLMILGFAGGSVYAGWNGGMEGAGKRCSEGRPGMAGMRFAGGGMMREEHRLRRALRDLGLDENQKVAIREIATRARKEAIKKAADIKIARIELREVLDKDPVDMVVVEAKLKQMESLKTDMHLFRIKVLEEVKTKLSPEQREKFRRNLRSHGRTFGRWNMMRGRTIMPRGEYKEK